MTDKITIKLTILDSLRLTPIIFVVVDQRLYIQWNLRNKETTGPRKDVLISEVP